MENKRFYLVDPLVNVDGAKGYVVYPDSPVSDKEKDKEFYKNLAVLPEQTHSLNVGIVEDATSEFPETDALITFKRNLPIGIVTADCVPILLYAPDVRGVAVVHAGWRGTLGGILDRVLDIFIARGADVSKILAWFGPSISMENYEVDAELARKFKDSGFEGCTRYYDRSEAKKPHIDLQQVNSERMLRRGLQKENVCLSASCTFRHDNTNHNPVYQSYRRDGNKAGRILTYIRMG